MNYAKTAILLAAMTALFLVIGYVLAGLGGAAIAFIIALAMNGYAFWNSDKMALRMHNAEPVTRSGAPELYDMVERLAQNVEMPTPAIYIIHSDQPNAFATGRNPENAAVAATTGIMKLLSTEELAGVMAHELAHIKNRDTLIMTVAATIAGAIGFLAQFAMFFSGQPGRRRHYRRAGGHDPRAHRCVSRPNDDLTHPRIRRRQDGGGDLPQPAMACLRPSQDWRLCRPRDNGQRRA